MLIRNLKSIHDIDNKKRLQSEYLQLSIDNEKIKEQRVNDYKNPNKPPPIPPQYKTNAEIQGDAMEQQKMVIDNLRSLGLDFQLATQISQDLKTSISGGDGNFLKFNKNFPYFKQKIEKGFNAKNATVDEIIEKIKDYFDDIDSSIGLTLGGTSSTNFFSKPLTSLSILPSSEAYQQLDADVDALVGVYSLPTTSVSGLKILIAQLITDSPSDDDFKSIESFPNIIKTRINKSIEILISKFNFPTSQFLYDFNLALSTVSSPAEAITLLAQLSRNIGMVNTKSFDKLKEVMVKIKEEEANQLATATGLASGISTTSLTPSSVTAAIANQQKENKQYVIDEIYSGLRLNELNDRLYNPATKGFYSHKYIGTVPTLDGLPPNMKTDDEDNVIYEYGDAFSGGLGRPGHEKYLPRIRFSGGTEIKVTASGKYKMRNWDGTSWVATASAGNINDYVFSRGEDSSGKKTTYYRYLLKDLRAIAMREEYPQIELMIDSNPLYQPKYDEKSRILAQNAGSKTHPYVGGYGLKKKKKKKVGEGVKKYTGDSDSDSDSEKSNGDIHIDINSHNGKNYHMNGEGFIKRRIKIGKGIEINKDEPKFRAFGKYIIHMPQLHNNNVLNFKHKSGGTIPSIKPVNIDENFKDFIIDVVNFGRVNDRHFDTLTEAEKNHFIKVVRGAGIIEHLKLKQLNHDTEKEDLNRLDLLLGEVNAGNDNSNIIKEAKVLIKKYVSNGRISRQKGFDMLAELE